MKGIHMIMFPRQFTLVSSKTQKSEDDHMAMMTGNHVNGELSDAAFHDAGLGGSDLSGAFQL